MSAPLADRLRPQTLDDVVGQRHLLAEGRCAVLLIPAKYLTWCFTVLPVWEKQRLLP